MKIKTKKVVFKSDNILVERRLKYKGSIFAKVGESVNVFDILGKGYKLSELIELPSSVAGYLEIGDTIKNGDTIKMPGAKGIMHSKKYPVNFDGVVYKKDKDKVTIGSYPAEHQLISGVVGEVVKVIPEKSVLIKSQGTVIEGGFGLGESEFGELRMVVSATNITEALEGKIVVYADVISRDVIDRLLNCGVKGIVTGGLQVTDQKYLVEKGMPFVVIYGFGDIAIDVSLVLRLSEFQNRFVYLRPGVSQVFLPEKIEKQSDVTEFVDLEIGLSIVCISTSNFGKYGKVEQILEGGMVRVNFFDDKKKGNCMFYELIHPLIS